jgi:hypothetical protein
MGCFCPASGDCRRVPQHPANPLHPIDHYMDAQGVLLWGPEAECGAPQNLPQHPRSREDGCQSGALPLKATGEDPDLKEILGELRLPPTGASH